MAGKCSELAATLVEIARTHVRDGASTVDDVVTRMQNTLPDLDRNRLVDSVIEVSEANKKAISDFQKRLQRFSREARTDKDLRTRIEELQKALDTNSLPESNKKSPAKRTEAIQQLYGAKNALMQQVAKSEPALAAKYTKQIQDGFQKLADTNFKMPQVKESSIEGSEELMHLRFQRDQVRRKVREKIDSLRPRSAWETGIDWMNAAKAATAGGEFSGIGRQGKFQAMVAPETIPVSLKNMWRAFQSEEGQFRAWHEMQTDPDWIPAVKSGLALPDMATNINDMEEAIMSPFARLTSGSKLGSIYHSTAGKFDRAYNTYIASLRFYGWKSVCDTTINGEPTALEQADIANAVNIFTGRGDMGSWNKHAAALNVGLFSPRYQWSRVQMLIGSPVWRASSPEMRKVILTRFYGRSALGTGMMYALYGLLFGNDRDFNLTFNPLSSDFGKIRMGNTRIDPMAGLVQPIVFMSKALSGQEKTSKGEMRDLRGDDASHSRQSIVTQYGRSKLAPVPGAVWNMIDGKDVVGNKTTVGGQLLGLSTPMTYGNIYQVMTSDLGVDKKFVLSVLSMLGEGVSIYGGENKNSK